MTTVQVKVASSEDSPIGLTVDGKRVDIPTSSQDAGVILIEIDGAVAEVRTGGTVDIHGDISGDVHAGGDVTCHDIGGDAASGGALACHDIAGDANAAGDINCDNIAGDVHADGNAPCNK